MGSGQTVAVFGAYGHTGRFVVAELRERGFVPVASGRDAGKLRALAESFAGLDVRPAAADDPASLDRALAAPPPSSTPRGPSPRRPPRWPRRRCAPASPTWTWRPRSRPTPTRSRTSPNAPATRGPRSFPRWPSSAASATCWPPPRWATGPPPTRCTSPTG
ncbi:hypothetical protein ACFQY7_11365 [Actinomadura luteofluorescens]|uniref:hypothetical protein n=1 Tax=Actinomadura luteofluorescens TaxID=46163 RepID=UPI003641F681